MPVFGKKHNCPTSADLAAFSGGCAEAGRVRPIEDHLAFCDFCAAEFALYVRYPPLDETTYQPPIPKHLFELAESILKRKRPQIAAGVEETSAV